MAEYLSKETLQEKLNRKKAGPANKRYTDGWNDAILMIKSMIHSEKAADVAPVRHGLWEARAIPRSDPDGDWIALEYHCSLCNRLEYRKENYCPNCGCKMDLEG